MGCHDGREACFHASYARPLSTVRQVVTPGFILRFPSPLQSSFALTSARSFQIEPTARVSSLFTTSPERVHIRGASQSVRFVPSTGDHSLSTVYSSLGLRGLFHPRAMSRDGSAFRGFSLRAARRLRQASLPPCRCRPSARPDLTIRRPPSDASASRRCSTRSSVHTGSVLSLTGRRSPLRVRSPPGSLRYGWGCGFPAAHRSRHFDLRGSLARTTYADAPSVSPP